ncbi:MAG: hypothetical protein R3F54_03375 [Alphaproteobacteria bacterium]
MADSDSKKAERRQATVLPLERRLHDGPVLERAAFRDDWPVADPLLQSLRRLGDDMLREPVPDRLVDSLRRKPSWYR